MLIQLLSRSKKGGGVIGLAKANSIYATILTLGEAMLG